ncbi:uncharacterized protein LOC141881914 [Acropora palmata]|uniref:uncharacterized protein LOC141881914 n=1 Tax=Acropora palmata TaxID=6131 RepID=UPI003DA082A0
MASCSYSSLLENDSTPCGPKWKNPEDFQCIALKDCSRDVLSHLRAYKVVHDMVQNEVQLLLARGKTTEEKAPVRHEFGEQDTHLFPETPKAHYKPIYLNAIDTVTQSVATRFEQEDFKIYVNIQKILLKSFASVRCDTELAEVVKMYSGDLDSFKLKQLLTTASRVNGV